MTMAPIPTPEVLWRKPPALALAAVRGMALGRLAGAVGRLARRMGRRRCCHPEAARRAAAALARKERRRACIPSSTSECDWLVADEVLPVDVVTRNRRFAEAALRSWTPVFTHGDLHIEHVFVDGDEITGILDWSEASQGDALYDIATLTLAHEEHLDDFLAGYGTDVDRSMIRAWWSWRCLVAVPWLFENGYGAPKKYPEVGMLRSLS